MMLLLWWLLTVAWAQEIPSGSLVDLQAELGVPGAPPTGAELEDRVYRVSRRLRCPVCQGSSIQDSPVESAVNMRKQVHQLVEAGYSVEQVEEYFVHRYGEWVLLNPRATGVNWLVWVGPTMAGAVGFVVLLSVVTRWRREDGEPVDTVEPRGPIDEYEQRLLDEIDR
jgi:cytochrome c-type biogenesis protein CcmH